MEGGGGREGKESGEREERGGRGERRHQDQLGQCCQVTGREKEGAFKNHTSISELDVVVKNIK